MANVSLTAAMRTNLTALQQTAELLTKTQTRLATGMKVNSALDDPISYFTAEAHRSLATDLASYQNDMGEAVQAIKAADDGITKIKDLLTSAKALANSAKTADSANRTAYMTQYNEVLNQIDDIATDSLYGGINLLDGDTMEVKFSATGSLSVSGTTATTASAGLNLAQQTDWATNTNIDTALTNIGKAVDSLKVQAAKLSSNLSIINIRQDFTTSMINTLKEGADKLTLADTNEEGANLLMLQTRQQLGITSLSIASQNAQSVLQLFG